jgi:hypothetical protein
MTQAGARDWRPNRRLLVGLVVGYAILIQALATPFLRIKAAELARLDDALAVLCLTGDGPDHDRTGERKTQHSHGLDCCLPCGRFDALDTPALVVALFHFEPTVGQRSERIRYASPQRRAPPTALTSVLRPRAPPVSVA